MATSFRQPAQVVRRTLGYYSETTGDYVPAVDPMPTTIMATITPAHALEYQKIQVLQNGRVVNKMLRLNTDVKLNPAQEGDYPEGHPGDILLHIDGLRYLIINELDHRVLKTSVSHFRYLAEWMRGGT